VGNDVVVPAGPAGRRHRLLILAVLCTSILIVSMDVTIINVALPALVTDLRASITELQWTVDAYTVVLACFLMLAGATADRVGRRRVFQTGLVLFGVGSLLCSLAPTVGWLIGARVVQALGGAMLNPVAMSIITNVFTDVRERARAIGVWGAMVGISLGVGPVLGGLLVDTVGWRAIFWVNIPVVLAAWILTARLVPESRAARPRRADPVGQLLVVALLGSTVAAVIEGPRLGWSSAGVLGLAALAVVALVSLVVWERRHPEPLVELRFFRSAPFASATVIAVCAFAAFGSLLFLSALYLQDVRGLGALLSGQMVAARGARLPLVLGGSAMVLVALTFSQLSPTTPLWLILLAHGVFGCGFALLNPPITNTAVNGMPPERAGVAAAVASTSRQAGQSFGVAVSGTVVATAASTAAGVATAWAVVTPLTVAVVVLGVLGTTARARASAARVAALFPAAPSPARAS
jgi:EmrB/QacA subfamily drug resistance transporter